MVFLKLTSSPGDHSVPVSLHISYCTSGKLLHIAEPQLSHLKNGNMNYMTFSGLLLRLHELIRAKNKLSGICKQKRLSS